MWRLCLSRNIEAQRRPGFEHLVVSCSAASRKQALVAVVTEHAPAALAMRSRGDSAFSACTCADDVLPLMQVSESRLTIVALIVNLIDPRATAARPS
jgi:hypothetical protein